MRVNVYAAKSQLSRLLERAVAGEEVIVTRNGKPLVKLVPVGAARPPRRLGGLRGKIRVASDFDAPLPDDVVAAFEGR